MTKFYRTKHFFILFLVLVLSIQSALAIDSLTNNQRSLSEVLNPDGTLKKGVSGSFNTQGFVLTKGKNGEPVFRDAITNGNDKWDNSPSNRIVSTNITAVVIKGTEIYAAGNGVFRWNGTKWDVIGEAINIGVKTLVFLGDDLYIGGSFTTVGGVAAKGVAKWNGATWTTLGAGIEGSATSLAVSGSNLYVGGYFTSAGGNTAIKHIARWNGSAWSALGTGVDNTVNAIAVSGNDVYVGGVFTAAGSVANTKYVAKWNGSVWTAMGTAALNSTVDAIAVSGSNVYVGGTFNSIGSQSIRGIARWNGSTWSALGTSIIGAAKAIAVSGTDVYVGGNFTNAGGATINRIAKWNGTAWSNFGTGADDDVYAIALSGTDIYVGGEFNSINQVSGTSRLAKWNGTVWSGFSTGVTGAVNAVAISGTDVYVGGGFSSIYGLSNAKYIAKWDGTNWTALGTGLNNTASAIAISGTDVYVGGSFTAAGNNNAIRYLAKWNGSAWSAVGTGVDNTVNAIAVSGNNLYVGGNFTSAGGDTNAKYLAKWNGTEWSTLGSGVDGAVRSIAVSATGDLYVGGNFINAGGAAVNRIAKWNGTTWSNLNSGVDGTVNAIAFVGGDMYVGGSFTAVGGNTNLKYLAKWNGSTWSGLGTGPNGTINTIAVVGTDIYVGGFFQSAGGNTSIGNIAKWDGTSWSSLGSGTNSTVNYIATAGGDLYVGGTFSIVGNNITWCFSIYHTGAILPPDHTNTFVTTWDTDKMTTGNLIIPSEGTNYQYYWEKVGDESNTNSGAYQTNSSTLSLSAIQAKTGVYKVYIKGTYDRIIMGDERDKSSLALIEVNQWGNISWKSMESAFAGCINFTTLPANAPDLSKVTSMYAMFNSARIFNQDISNWDVSNVTNMGYLFAAANTFNQNISNWKVGKVTNMLRIFNGARAFNQDIKNWDVSKVTNMQYIFAGAIAFNQDLSTWNVSSVSNMIGAFSGATSYNQSLGSWVLRSNVNLGEMLNDSGLSPANYGLTLKGWVENINIPTSRSLGALGLKYTAVAKQYRDLLTKPVAEGGKGWAIVDAGFDHSNAFITIWDTDKLPSGYNVSFNTYGNQYEYYWEKIGDEANTNSGTYLIGANSSGQSLVIPQMASGTGKYKLYIKSGNGTFTGFQTYGHAGQAQALTTVESWGNIVWTNLMGAFLAAKNLTSLPADAPNLSQVSDLSFMFAGAESFNQNIANWNVSNVSNMSSMFSGAGTFNQNLGNWVLKSDVNLTSMLNNSGLSAVNYGLTLKGWAENVNIPTGRTLGAIGLSYPSSAQQYRDILTGNKNWTINDGGVLPIKLLSFKAKNFNTHVHLNWQTASEQNNKQFILSRSADGQTFTELTRIAGAGNSSSTKNYSYTDRNPLSGANYYKLEQVDSDGMVNLVGVEVVNFRLSVSVVTVYPNPTVNEINLTIPTDFGKTTIKVSVLDALGRTVHAEIIKKTEGQASYKLNNSKLPSGQYIIRLNSEQKTESLKLLVK